MNLKNRPVSLGLAFVIAFFLYPVLQRFIPLPSFWAFAIVAFVLALVMGG